MTEGFHPVISRPLQARFLTIPQAPLCYWLRDRFFELLAGRTLGDVADVCQGLATADDARFVRFVWEVRLPEWALSVRERRWVPFEKGGGYGKWFGHHFWAVDWEHNGARIKAFPPAFVRNEQQYFKEGWTYSYMARGSLGVRWMVASIFAHKSPAILTRDRTSALAVLANCRFGSVAGRAISATIQLPEGCVSRVPLPKHIPDSLASLESICIALKRHLVAIDLTERSFACQAPTGATLTKAWRHVADRSDAVAAILHTLEGLAEREVLAVYGLASEDLAAVLDEAGTPAGWYPFIAGYDACPELPEGLAVDGALLAPLHRASRLTLPPEALADLKHRLRALYEAGASGSVAKDDDTATAVEDGDGEESETAGNGARIPIPTETFLEELSQKLEIHPISVHWLLRELREKDGVVSKPELVRFVEDYVSIMVLRLLGHQWPREIQEHGSFPSWADKNAIIPLTEGASEPPLIVRVRARLAEDFDADRGGAVEREFQDVTGKPLTGWLASDFFKRHVSQFRKRPIAWQLASTGASNAKRRGRGAFQIAPAFSCLLYYHRIDADLLPKLRTQYVGPLRTSLQTELGALEKLSNRSADQDERRVELEGKLEELKTFDQRLEHVLTVGFASPALDAVAAKEPLDKCCSRDGRAPVPNTRDAFLAQEGRYDPDLNDGVRVNVAPLQRAGLLAADVLAAKEIEKAIANRAEWRADERRWCREGKLPQLGWWPPNRSGAVLGDEEARL